MEGLDVAGELRERLLVEFSPACCAFAAATASGICFFKRGESAGPVLRGFGCTGVLTAHKLIAGAS